MPGTTRATSQLDWLISTTAMIVLSWSRATRDLLKSFGWGIRALHQLDARRWCHFLVACPIPSRRWREWDSNPRSPRDRINKGLIGGRSLEQMRPEDDLR